MPIDFKKVKENFERKDKMDRLNLKPGENLIRLLPPTSQALTQTIDYMAISFQVHFSVGPTKKVVLCPKTFDTPKHQHVCPVCDLAWKFYNDKVDPNAQNQFSQIRPNQKFLFNAVDLNDLKKGVQPLELGITVYKTLLNYINTPVYGSMLDIDQGNNVTIYKEVPNNNKINTKYTVTIDPQKVSIRAHLPANWQDQLDLLQSKLPQKRTAEELRAILTGEIVEEEDDNTEAPAAPAMRVAVPPTSEAAVVMTAPPAAPVAPVTPAAAPVTRPECFATEVYAPGRPECKACASKRECVVAGLGIETK